MRLVRRKSSICGRCGREIRPDEPTLKLSRGPLSLKWDKYHRDCTIEAALARLDAAKDVGRED